MQAILARAFGGPEVLKLEDVPDPVAGRGQVRVRVAEQSEQARELHAVPHHHVGGAELLQQPWAPRQRALDGREHLRGQPTRLLDDRGDALR